MWAAILKFVGPAALALVIGFSIGQRWERAEYVDELEAQREKAEQALKSERAKQGRRQEALESHYATVVRDYVKALRDAEADAARSQQIAQRAQGRADELSREIDEIQRRFSGDSVCSLDPGDIGLLNDAINAANRSGGPGLPGANEPDPAG